MKKKIILRSIVIILVILNIFVMYLLSQPQNNKVLEDIKVIDLKNDRSIAIWVQDNNTDEWHEADSRDSWPSPTTHGFVGAECSDSEGTTIDWEKVLTFDLANQTATIKTKQTAYCTLYFAKGEPALDWLKKKGGTTFAGSAHTTVIDGMYRFVGANTQVLNNYICFGTTIESECLNKSDKYLYRILGITSEADTIIGLYSNQLKIIKTYPLEEKQQWHSSQTAVRWDDTAIKAYLNENFLSTIKNGTNGTYWESMISSHKWYIKGQYDYGATIEPKDTVSGESKIGLMYGTDYQNAYKSNNSNWLFITNEWGGNKWEEEWTMTSQGIEYNDLNAWCIFMSGGLGCDGNSVFTNKKIVRPVFYLQSGVNLTGEGTKNHPYIITTKNNA